MALDEVTIRILDETFLKATETIKNNNHKRPDLTSVVKLLNIKIEKYKGILKNK